MNERRQRFDIQERTFSTSGETDQSIAPYCCWIEVGKQIVRSATSIGSNVEEADAAESKRDFIHKMSIAHKETRETRYWLRIIQAALLDDDEVRGLIQESDELVRILYTIVENARQSSRSKTGR